MDIFCKIINGEIPSKCIYEDEVVMVIMDVNPSSNGHLLVIPKKHYQDLYDIPEDVLNHIMKIGRKMCNLLNDKLHCDGISLCQNNGFVQEVKHFHLHIIPKYKEKKDIEDIDKIYNKITG